LVNAIPSATFTATSPIATGDTCLVNYTGSASSTAYYNWDLANAQNISGSGQGPYQLRWLASGVKPLKLIVVENGCSSPQVTYPVMVNPSSSFTMDTTACQGVDLLVTYIGQATSTATYSWNFGGAQVISGVGQGPYHIKWNTSGQKSVTLTVYENGLSSSLTTNSINIFALPSISISQNNEICLYDSVTLTSTVNSGQSPFTYLWSSLDTTNTTTVGPIHDSLFYLMVTDGNACAIMDSTLVLVREPYANEEICLVTVDSTTKKNVIVWQKTPSVGTDYIKVYKESTIVNVYDSIGYRPYDSLGFFLDINSQPKVKAAKYKIAVVDSCGNESAMSPHHRTMHLTINKGIGWTFNLIWTPYEGFQVQTYRIWRWNLANGWAKIDSVSGGATTYTDNPPFGLVYYFVEIVPPNPCNITKAKTNYNHSRSNRTSTIQFVGMEEVTNQDLTLKVYPNPYSGKTNIVYELLEHSEVTIEIYSSMGQKVADIHQGTQSQGIYRYQFNAEDYGFGAGVYYLRMKVGNQMISRKLVQVK
jgi:hypothetical protein